MRVDVVPNEKERETLQALRARGLITSTVWTRKGSRNVAWTRDDEIFNVIDLHAYRTQQSEEPQR